MYEGKPNFDGPVGVSDWFGPDPFGNYYDPPLSLDGGVTRFLNVPTSGRLWVDGEILLWSQKRAFLPAMVTTSPDSTSSAQAGIPGQDHTSVLWGDSDILGRYRSGFRLSTGFWFTPEHINGIEAIFFGLGGDQATFSQSTSDHAILARPYVDLATGNPAALLVSYPQLWSGSVSATSHTQLSGAEVLWQHTWLADESSRITWVAGYRNVHQGDSFQVKMSRTSLSAATGYAATNLVQTSDQFWSSNDFNGGELGLLGQWWSGRWALQVTGKAALGENSTNARIAGQTKQYVLNSGVYSLAGTQSAGMLALPSNIGSYNQSSGAAVGELGLRIQYACTPLVKLSVGYNYLYWSNICRLYDSLDLTIDTKQLPPNTGSGMRPGFAFHENNFWAQGFTFGIQCDF